MHTNNMESAYRRGRGGSRGSPRKAKTLY